MDTNLGLVPQMPMVGRATLCAPRHMTFRRERTARPTAPSASTPNAFAIGAVHRFDDLIW
jgi:hypothetical protein